MNPGDKLLSCFVEEQITIETVDVQNEYGIFILCILYDPNGGPMITTYARNEKCAIAFAFQAYAQRLLDQAKGE